MADVLLYQGESNPNDVRLRDVATYLLVAGTGSFAETGVAAALRQARIIAAVTGTFAETGQAVSLLTIRTLTSAVGSYVLTGNAAGLLHSHTLAAVTGAFTTTGQSASLRAARTLSAALGQFAESGQAAGLRAARTISVSVGANALAGQNAGLSQGSTDQHLTLSAEAASFSLSGQQVALIKDPPDNVSSGVFIRGRPRASQKAEPKRELERAKERPESPVRHLSVHARVGAFALRGAEAMLRAARGALPGAVDDADMSAGGTLANAGAVPLIAVASDPTPEAPVPISQDAAAAHDIARAIEELIASTLPSSYTLGAECGAVALQGGNAELAVQRVMTGAARRDALELPTQWTPESESENDDLLIYAAAYDLLTRG